MNWLSLASTAVTLVFAGFVLYRYAYRGGAHLLLWGLGLALYAIGTFAEFYLALHWSAAWFHLWYLGGAMLTAAWLGQGSVYLLVRKPAWLPHALMALLALGSVYAVWRVFATPLDSAAFSATTPVSVQYKQIMPPGGARLLTIPFNIYGAIGLIGGALYSAWLFGRKRVLRNRVIGNVLIAAGGLMPALGGVFTRLGRPAFLYLSELLGAIIMFAGFLLVMTTRPEAKPRVTDQPGRHETGDV